MSSTKVFGKETIVIDDAPHDVLIEMKNYVADLLAMEAADSGYYIIGEVSHNWSLRCVNGDDGELAMVMVLTSTVRGKPIIDEWERILSNG